MAAKKQVKTIAYKGFDKDWQCRGFQFEVGKTYKHAGKVVACESGFHACESPFDVWAYYDVTESKFAVVELSGKQAKHGDDTKIAAAEITIKAELTLPEFIKSGIDWLLEKTKGGDLNDNGGNSAQIGSSGNFAQIGSSGNFAQIGSSGNSAQIGSSGHSAQIGSSGNSAQIGSSGHSAQIGSSGHFARIGSSGNSAQIGSSGHFAQIGSSGDSAQIGSSGHSAQIGSSGNSAQIGSSGNSAQIGSSGNFAQIGSSGNFARIDATGENAVIACAAPSTVKAGKNGCFTIPYHDGKRTRFAVGYVGEDGIKPDTWYTVRDGKIAEAS